MSNVGDAKATSRECRTAGEHAEKIKPGKRPYIVFSLLFLPIICLYAFVAVTKDPAALQGVAIAVLIVLTFFGWIASNTILLGVDRITHCSWGFRRRTILFKDISKWSIQLGVFRYWDRLKPTSRLEIHPGKDSGGKPIIIPIRLFKKKDIDRVLDRLPPEAECR